MVFNVEVGSKILGIIPKFKLINKINFQNGIHSIEMDTENRPTIDFISIKSNNIPIFLAILIV